MLTIEALNAISVQEFTAALGSIFEHSPWVAARAALLRPFVSREQLHQAMGAEVARARAAGRLMCGANVGGALNSPASMAASDSETSFTDLPK